MKSGSLSSPQANVPFTYLRSPEKIARMFGRSQSVLIAAPAGSGRRTLVFQWLGNRAGNAVWFYVAKPPSGPVVSPHRVVPLTILNNACQHLLAGECPDALVIEFADLELTHLQVLLPDLERIRQHTQLIILCERCDSAVYDAVCSLHFVPLGIDDIALEEHEVKEVVHLVFGSAAPSRLHHALFQHTQGWIPVVSKVIANFLSQPLQDSTACEQQCLSIAKQAVNRISVDFNHHHMAIIKTVSLLSRLPMNPLHEHDIDEEWVRAADQAITRGFLKFDFANQAERTIRCTLLARMLLAHHPAASYQRTFTTILDLLRRRQLYDIVIPAMLMTDQLAEATDTILEAGDKLIARFHINSLLQWILALDSRVHITDLLVLLMAVRCSLYQGSIHDVVRFVNRLNQTLSQEALADLRRQHGDKQYYRFVSEFKLYCHALKRRPNPALDAVAGGATDGSGDHVLGLLQASLSHAENGELSSAIPLLEAGVRVTAANLQIPLHLMFSIVYVWVLVLSCRLEQAEKFLEKLRNTLSQNSVVYLGAYDWVDVMDVLLLRIRGDLALLDEKLNVLLGSQVFTADFQKHYLLLNVKADASLVQGQFYEARHAVSKLAAAQTTTTRQSYWFAPAPIMMLSLSVLESQATPYLPPSHHLCVGTTIAEQTETVWMLKLCLYKRDGLSLDGILEKLHEQCTQNGQWMRVLELDVLRAICLYRQGRRQEGIALFEKAFSALEQSACLGVLLDPFLLWEELLAYPKHYSVRARARELFCMARPGHRFEDRQAKRKLLHEQLSRREQQVLELMVEGKASTEIADLLCISITTVRTHTQNIYRKLEVTNRAEAVVAAIRLKLVDMAEGGFHY